jgi:hypothetical protein
MRYFFDTEFYDHDGHVDLISIGVVGEDSSEFYMENSDFDWDSVPKDHWIQANVRPHLEGGGVRASKKTIGKYLYAFCDTQPIFWGYFADYDWVALSSLYGCMVNIPQGWPMFCRDVKQLSEMTGLDPFRVVPQFSTKHNALNDAIWTKACFDWIISSQ